MKNKTVKMFTLSFFFPQITEFESKKEVNMQNLVDLISFPQLVIYSCGELFNLFLYASFAASMVTQFWLI